MLLAAATLPTMNAMAKFLVHDYPLSQVVWARFAGHLLAMTILFWPKLGPRLFRSARPRLQLFRSAVMFLSNTAFIGGLPMLKLATASAIIYTAPMIVTALSVLLLKEKVGVRRWLAVSVGFVGMLIIVRPGGEVPLLGGALVLIAAATFAIYQILTRRLAAYDRPETTNIYTAFVATAVMTLALPFDYRLPESAVDIANFIGVGALGGLGQYFVVKALQHGPASVISPFGYAELITATTLGYLVFGAFPDAWTWVGAAVIVGSGLYIAYREGLRGLTQ